MNVKYRRNKEKEKERERDREIKKPNYSFYALNV